MLRYVLSIGGIVASFFLIKNREFIGDMIGNRGLIKKLGGNYYVVVYIAIFLFFWCIAELTNTTTILFRPLEAIMPGLDQANFRSPDAF